MLHKAWSSIEEVPFCFSSSYVKFEGHTALKIVKFDPNWALPVWDDILTPLYIDPGVNISYDILTPGSIYRNDILTPLTIFWPPSQ